VKDPPKKRRKLTDRAPRSLSELKGVSENGVPNGFIPIARVNLHLNYAETNPELGSSDACIDLPRRIPVQFHARNTNVSNKSGSAPTIVGREDTDHDGLRLELKSVTDEEVIFSERSTDPALLGVGKLLQLTSKSLCADFCRRVDPVACYQATLLCLPDKKSFRLELALLWIDSLEVQGLSKFRDDQLEVYTRYVIREPQDDFKEDASHIFRRFWQEKELNQQAERWSARDFYKNVHVPENTPKASADIKCGMVESRLYPFQRRAVRWLLQREGMELHSNGKVVQVQKASALLCQPFVHECYYRFSGLV
jgi:E3 ubiquitin-protein ligase SHPRH